MPRIFIAIIFLAGAALLGVFYARPAWQRFHDLGREAAELEEISKEFDELIENRDDLLGRINAVSKDNLDRVDRILPQGPRASDFLVAMEALTTQNSMALRRIDLVSPEGAKGEKSEASARSSPGQPKPAAAAAPGPVKETQALPFNLQVAGSYTAFKKFLESMERNIRLIDVEGISFGASGKGEISEFTVKAKTYYQ